MDKIRKISIGPDYKDSMSYSLNQSCIRGDHEISRIKQTGPEEYEIEVQKADIIQTWKKVQNMPVVIEYKIDTEI